jgi:hypothetical protein
MISYTPDYTPSASDETGPNFDTGNGRKRRVSKVLAIPEITDDVFDDTFRLREANVLPASQNNERFARGVPTNGRTSSDNYPKSNVKIIDGEHKTLLTLGKINEAMEDDDHSGHIMEHRLLLASPELTETQRMGLMEHLADHVKKSRKKLKAVNEALQNQNRHDINPTGGFRPGVGTVSRVKKALTDDVIPQDTDVDLERKRTAGNMAMESRVQRFDNAVRKSYGTRRGL